MNGQVAVVKCSPIEKNMRKDFKTFPELKSQVHSQIKALKQRKLNLLRLVKAPFCLYGKTFQGYVSEFQMCLIPVTNIIIELSRLRSELM